MKTREDRIDAMSTWEDWIDAMISYGVFWIRIGAGNGDIAGTSVRMAVIKYLRGEITREEAIATIEAVAKLLQSGQRWYEHMEEVIPASKNRSRYDATRDAFLRLYWAAEFFGREDLIEKTPIPFKSSQGRILFRPYDNAWRNYLLDETWSNRCKWLFWEILRQWTFMREYKYSLLKCKAEAGDALWLINLPMFIIKNKGT